MGLDTTRGGAATASTLVEHNGPAVLRRQVGGAAVGAGRDGEHGDGEDAGESGEDDWGGGAWCPSEGPRSSLSPQPIENGRDLASSSGMRKRWSGAKSALIALVGGVGDLSLTRKGSEVQILYGPL